MAKAFAVTLGIILTIIGIVIYRTGVYKEVTIAPGQMGPYVLVYKNHSGEYHKIIPVIESVEAFMADKKLPCPLTFGRYLDNPNEVEHDRLSSHGGCIFPGMTEELNQAIIDGNFATEALPQKEYVIARFNGSPSVGPMVVYPKMDKWFGKYGYKKAGPVIELYQILENKSVMTTYLFQYSIEP